MSNNSKDLKELQSFWYQKLKDDGFKDIETDEYNLKLWQSQFFQNRYSVATFTAKEAYYQAAGAFLHSYRFDNELERLIWTLHTDGISNHKIAQQLKPTYKINRVTVNTLVRRLAKLMLSKLNEVTNE